MVSSRRDFLRLSAAGSVAALSGGWTAALAAAQEKAAERGGKPLSILVLGGTGLIGPAIVQACVDAGHKVTMFNRGKTRPHLFPDLEKLRGDRDPDKGEGLKALEGRSFDVVFDDCGYFPRIVKASAELLAPTSGFYVFVSSISAYADNDKEDQDETAPVATMEDPTLETFGPEYRYYGPLKALCEQETLRVFEGRSAVVRPGYIVGPEDGTDRFTYWPLRVARGGEVLAPGSPEDPIQIIDVRDLAAFMLTLGASKTTGTFNVCGPAQRLTMGAMLEACAKVTKSEPTFTWVPASFLRTQEGVDLPIWAPHEGDTVGFHTWKNDRAIAAGLQFHPLERTIEDLLAWFRTLPDERQAKVRAGISAETEKTLLDAWKASQGAGG